MNNIDTGMAYYTTIYTENAPSPKEAPAPAAEALADDAAEQAAAAVQDQVEISEEAAEAAGVLRPEAEEAETLAEQMRKMLEDSENRFKINVGKPSDNVGRLAERLVAAAGQFEVRAVIADAGKDMLSLKLIASMGEGEDKATAQRILNKLERLMNNAGKKLDSLNSEDLLRIQQARAQQNKQTQRAQDIKAELRRKKLERERKEQQWLREAQTDVSGGQKPPVSNAAAENMQLDAASEAEIAMQAEAQASAEIAMESGASASGGIAAGAAPAAGGEGAAPAEGGGEAAAAADAGGGIDISA